MNELNELCSDFFPRKGLSKKQNDQNFGKHDVVFLP